MACALAPVIAVSCGGEGDPPAPAAVDDVIACVPLAGTELLLDGVPVAMDDDYCSIHPVAGSYDIWLTDGEGFWDAIVGIVPGGEPDPQGTVELEVTSEPVEGEAVGPPGSAWLTFHAEGESWSTEGGGTITLQSYEQAATGGIRFVTLPDGSQLVFSVVTFEPAVNVVSKSGEKKTVSGAVKVVSNKVPSPSDCPDVVPGGAECVEFDACGATPDCTCPDTQCHISGKCCIVGGAPCGADDECCSRYCSPHKMCAPRPAIDPCGQGGAGGGGAGVRVCVQGHDPLVAGNALECVCDAQADVDDYLQIPGYAYVDACSPEAECCIEHDDGSNLCRCVALSVSNPGDTCAGYAVGRGMVTTSCP